MDEVIIKMGKEINYTNPDEHVTETEKTNRVIKYKFRIAYYRLPHKNIPRIMIHHLEMNLTQYVNLFLAKGIVLAHYIPCMIMLQMN